MTDIEKTALATNSDQRCVCPLEAALTVAEQYTELLHYKNTEDKYRAVAGIAVTRAMLHDMRREFPCSKTGNDPDCPLRDWVTMARGNVGVHWPRDQYVIDLSAGLRVFETHVEDTGPAPSTGHYL